MTQQHQSASREWNSSAYHRLSEPQVSWGKKVLARLRLRGDETVLDAGCGTGRLTAELLEAPPRGRVVGADLSQNMLRQAREHLKKDFGQNLGFVACDLLHLPFKRAFDGIVSTAAFHWILDHDQLFGNLRQALVPGGWLEAQCGGGPNLERLRKRADALASTETYARFFAGFHEPWLFQDAQSAACTLRRAGFVDVETFVEPAMTVLESEQRYAEFVRNIIFREHLRRLPNDELRGSFVINLAKQAGADDPPFSLDYWRLNLSGRC